MVHQHLLYQKVIGGEGRLHRDRPFERTPFGMYSAPKSSSMTAARRQGDQPNVMSGV